MYFWNVYKFRRMNLQLGPTRIGGTLEQNCLQYITASFAQIHEAGAACTNLADKDRELLISVEFLFGKKIQVPWCMCGEVGEKYRCHGTSWNGDWLISCKSSVLSWLCRISWAIRCVAAEGGSNQLTQGRFWLADEVMLWNSMFPSVMPKVLY